MSSQYRTPDEERDDSDVGYDVSHDPESPNLYSPYPQQNPVNILTGPGYKLFKAQSDASNWAKYVRWLS